MSKLFVVFGITGAQGKSVLKALVDFNKTAAQDAAFRIRGLTRSTDSDSSKKLLAEFPGLELVAGDSTKREDLDRLLTGATHVFAVTPNGSGPNELEIGTDIAESAKKAGVQYIWWSSLPNVAQISGDKLHVPHFTNKFLVGEKMTQLGLKVISISPAFYYSNWTSFLRPSQPEEGVLQWFLPLKPDTVLSAFDVDETGLAVAKTLTNPDEFVGSTIRVCGDHIPVQQYLDTMASLSGKKARLVSVPYLDWAKAVGFPGAEELANMCEWFNQYGYYGPGADVNNGRKLVPELSNFKDWATKVNAKF